MIDYIWIEGEKNLREFCLRRFKSLPQFTETIGHCGQATIYMIYKIGPNIDRRPTYGERCCYEMYFVFMDTPNGAYYESQINELTRQTYEQIRADRRSILIQRG